MNVMRFSFYLLEQVTCIHIILKERNPILNIYSTAHVNFSDIVRIKILFAIYHSTFENIVFFLFPKIFSQLSTEKSYETKGVMCGIFVPNCIYCIRSIRCLKIFISLKLANQFLHTRKLSA